MQEPQTGSNVPPGDAYQPVSQSYPQQPYPPQSYSPQSYPPQNGYVQQPYPPQPGIVPADQGLSDTAAGALAYVTIIPAILFLILAPYNTRPFVKFHSFQCLGLAVLGICLSVLNVIPLLGQIIFVVGWLAMLVIWVLCLVKASQGSYLKLPVISDFASKQAGYPIA